MGAALRSRLDALCIAAVQRGEVPGIVALVTDARADRWVGAFGLRRLGDDAAMSADTIGWIASMTKPLTTAAVLQGVERGVLSLDAPAATWLPELREVPVLEGFDATGQALLRPARSAVTLRQLLTHTGGFGYEWWSDAIARQQRQRPAEAPGARQHRYFGWPMLYDPGTRWNYGVGVDWAGRVLEAASGMRLGDWFAQHLTGPLGMDDTRFGVRPQDFGRAAAMHQRAADGRLTPSDAVPPAAPEWHMGGGGLYGTVPDYGRFIRMILNRGLHEGRQILRSDSVDQMCRNQTGALRVQPLRTAMPEISNDAEFMPGVAKAWTLGLQINLEPAASGRPAGALMWAGLSNCYFWIDPANGIAGVLMAQLLPFADRAALGLFDTLERIVYEQLYPGA